MAWKIKYKQLLDPDVFKRKKTSWKPSEMDKHKMHPDTRHVDSWVEEEQLRDQLYDQQIKGKFFNS